MPGGNCVPGAVVPGGARNFVSQLDEIQSSYSDLPCQAAVLDQEGILRNLAAAHMGCRESCT